MTTAAKMLLFALPLSVLGGHGKSFLEGQADDRDFQDSVEEEHGVQVKSWMKLIIDAVDHYAAIQ